MMYPAVRFRALPYYSILSVGEMTVTKRNALRGLILLLTAFVVCPLEKPALYESWSAEQAGLFKVASS